MIKAILIGILFFANGILLAQNEVETLFGDNVTYSGGGGPEVKLTQFNGKNKLIWGGRGGWLINGAFLIGGGGYGGELNFTGKEPQITMNMGVGYGGVIFGYVHKYKKLVHLEIPVLLGAGGADIQTEDPGFPDLESESSGFFVVEPAVNLVINVTEFFRIGAGAGYRNVFGSNLTTVANSRLSSPAINIFCMFGER